MAQGSVGGESLVWVELEQGFHLVVIIIVIIIEFESGHHHMVSLLCSYQW